MERSRVCIVVLCGNEKYSCEEVDDGYVEKMVRLLIDEYMIYKDYIKNLHKFLNTKGQVWNIGHDNNCENENGYFIKIYKNSVDVGYNSTRINTIKIKNPKNQKFIDFINRRFLLKHICEKYNLPKDIQQYLINFFFKKLKIEKDRRD